MEIRGIHSELKNQSIGLIDIYPLFPKKPKGALRSIFFYCNFLHSQVFKIFLKSKESLGNLKEVVNITEVGAPLCKCKCCLTVDLFFRER